MQVVIVDDLQVMRDYLRKVCRDLGLEVLAEAADGQSGLAAILQFRPDLVLLDLELPDLDGFQIIDHLKGQLPQTKILVVSQHFEPFTIYRLERARVAGFLDKNSVAGAAVRKAIEALKSGQTYFSDRFYQVKAARLRDRQSFGKILSPREQEILSLLGQPMTNGEIGKALGIANPTVEKHRFNIMRKLGIRPMFSLIRYARAIGFSLWSWWRKD